MHTLYLATSPSGKRYVGVTKDFDERVKQHFRITSKENTPFGRALNKYRDSIAFEVLYQDEDRNKIEAMEEWAVQYYITLAPLGYNSTLGGKGAKGSRSEQYKLKCKLVQTKHRLSNECKVLHRRWKQPIACSNGQFYANMYTAAEVLDVWPQNIRACCEGSKMSAGGYSFKYVDKNEINYAPNYKSSHKISVQVVDVSSNVLGVFKSIKAAAAHFNQDYTAFKRVVEGRNAHVNGYYLQVV